MSKLKPCQICNKVGHYPYQCFQNPNRTKYIKKAGKQGAKWTAFRRKWFIDNPANFYSCYICGVTMTPAETTLDHKIPRSRAPHLRYENSNIYPCCWSCNSIKGSTVDKPY